MSVHKTAKGKYFVVWYEGEGAHRKQRKKLFGRGDAGELQAIAFDRELKREKGKDHEDISLTVEDIYREYEKRHQVAKSTYIQNQYRFVNHIYPLLGRIAADRIGTKEIDLYIKRRIEKDGVKRSTVSAEIRLVKAAFSWAQRQEPPLIRRNLIASHRFKGVSEDKGVPLPPTVDEFSRILACSEPHLARALMIHWHSGIRPGGELYRLRWEHVDFTNLEMRVYSAYKGGPSIRMVPISANLEPELRRWLDQDRLTNGSNTWNLPVVRYNDLPVKSLKRAWRNAKIRAKITRKIRLYDLRHAFASHALRAGGDLKSVSEVMGHSRADTTLREYQHVTREQHREIVDLIPAAEGGNRGNILEMRLTRKNGISKQ